MVELRLENLDLDDSKQDTFVAVRVGEVQKLCRLSAVANKSYKFQTSVVGDRKFGRLDVFRRVGSTSIGIKNSGSGEAAQTVKVDLKDGPAMNFCVRLGANPEGQEKRRQEAEKLKAQENNSKVLAAKTYLLEHNLEERLSEAMQAVLRDKPQDPSSFIADMLKKSSGDYRKLPVGAGSGPNASPSEKQAMREEVKKALVKSASDGSVGNFMKGRAALREKAKEALLGGVKTGAIEKMAKESGSAAQAQARQALIAAAGNGTLEKAVKDSLAFSQTVIPAAKQAILKAAENGTLEKAVKDANQSGGSEDALRSKAKQALLGGIESGSLSKILQGNAQPGANAAEAERKAQVEALRKEAKNTLLQASSNGSLGTKLQDAMKNSKSSKQAQFQGKPSVGTWLMYPLPRE